MNLRALVAQGTVEAHHPAQLYDQRLSAARSVDIQHFDVRRQMTPFGSANKLDEEAEISASVSKTV